MKLSLLNYIASPDSHSPLRLVDARREGNEVMSGTLMDENSGRVFQIQGGVPILLSKGAQQEIEIRTASHYGYGWTHGDESTFVDQPWHYDKMDRAVPFSIPMGAVGLDGGCGNGRDTYRMAKAFPNIQIVAVDISDGAFVTYKRTRHLPNVHVIQGSILNLPLKPAIFDFAYSFGVLHHTPNPLKGFNEVSRVLKPGARFVTYLYSDFTEEGAPLRLGLVVTSLLRKATTSLSPPALRTFSYVGSPLIYFMFSLPAKIIRKLGMCQLAQRIPFHFVSKPFGATGDLYDRLGAKIEMRFNPGQIQEMFTNSGFMHINLGKIPDIRGWVAWGTKSSRNQ